MNAHKCHHQRSVIVGFLFLVCSCACAGTKQWHLQSKSQQCQETGVAFGFQVGFRQREVSRYVLQISRKLEAIRFRSLSSLCAAKVHQWWQLGECISTTERRILAALERRAWLYRSARCCRSRNSRVSRWPGHVHLGREFKTKIQPTLILHASSSSLTARTLHASLPVHEKFLLT